MKAARGTPAAGNSRLAVRPLDPEEATALPSIRRGLVSITSGTPLIVPEFEAAAFWESMHAAKTPAELERNW